MANDYDIDARGEAYYGRLLSPEQREVQERERRRCAAALHRFLVRCAPTNDPAEDFRRRIAEADERQRAGRGAP